MPLPLHILALTSTGPGSFLPPSSDSYDQNLYYSNVVSYNSGEFAYINVTKVVTPQEVVSATYNSVEFSMPSSYGTMSSDCDMYIRSRDPIGICQEKERSYYNSRYIGCVSFDALKFRPPCEQKITDHMAKATLFCYVQLIVAGVAAVLGIIMWLWSCKKAGAPIPQGPVHGLLLQNLSRQPALRLFLENV